MVVLIKRGVVSALDAATIARSRVRATSGHRDITGRAIDGPLAGRRLRPIVQDRQFWFALAAFLPDAKILSAC